MILSLRNALSGLVIMAAAAGGDASVVGEVHLSPLARMRHEEFELRRDLEAAIACGDAPLRGRGAAQGSKRVRNSQLQRLISRPFSTRFG